MAVKKGLNKGLSVLFQSTEEDYSKNLGITEEEIQNGVLEVSLDDIFPNPDQPRKVFNEKALEELANSIKINGVIMPIVLQKCDGGKYMIIAGERRFRASKIAGNATIPAIIKEYDERRIKEISLIENLQREDLNPIEAGNAMKQLMDDYGLTQEQLSERIGKSRSAVANTLRLLSLSDEVMVLVAEGKVSSGHAKSIVTLNKEEQIKLANRVVKEGLSVRDVEKAVKEILNPDKKGKKKTRSDMSVELKDLIYRMQQTFKTKVSAIGNDKKGRIYIDYYTTDDLDRLNDIVVMLEEQEKK
ncbi:MAG: ParB/RepB/Spo0J family partition protein [Clostridia bacterium]|nr:ParB/RepB/Spo0J family partition protein [Clostridia bacterium]